MRGENLKSLPQELQTTRVTTGVSVRTLSRSWLTRFRRAVPQVLPVNFLCHENKQRTKGIDSALLPTPNVLERDE